MFLFEDLLSWTNRFCSRVFPVLFELLSRLSGLYKFTCCCCCCCCYYYFYTSIIHLPLIAQPLAICKTAVRVRFSASGKGWLACDVPIATTCRHPSVCTARLNQTLAVFCRNISKNQTYLLFDHTELSIPSYACLLNCVSTVVHLPRFLSLEEHKKEYPCHKTQKSIL